MAGKAGGPQHNEKGRSRVLTEMKYPLVFFALVLCIVESTFGLALVRRSYSAAVTITFAGIMGGLFVLAILVVALLIYKVPTHVMLQPQARVTPAESEMALQAKRVRDATRILIQYSSERQKTPVMLLDALEKVEAILTGRSVDVLKATDNSSSLVRTAESPGEVKVNKQVVGPLHVPPDEVQE